MKQKILLDAIEYFIDENGYSPTVSELAEMLEQSRGPVHEKLILLEEKGYITTKPGKPRTIKVIRHVGEPKC